MLTPNASVSDCHNVNALKYWHLPITKNYPLPKYYIGQSVLHIIPHRGGEILHPVMVIGLFWGFNEWMYMIELPPNHPDFKHEVSEIDEVEEDKLEPI